MITRSDRSESRDFGSGPDPEFTRRLTASLARADEQRKRREMLVHLSRILPIVLLAAPIATWRLTSASGGGMHAFIDTLVRAAFLVDVGVHMDTALLSYLHLQLLPPVVGILLLVLVPGWLLTSPRPRQ